MFVCFVTSEGDAIKVFLRVRPPDTASSTLPCSTTALDVDTTKNSVTLLAKPDPKVFTFDSVADASSTQHGERKQFLCKCSFLEIYQEQVYDLLDPAAANLLLRENIKKGVFVDGLMEQVVATPNEAYQEEKNGVTNVRQSQLNLVDLAGSERQKDTNTVGIRLKEAGKINKSLSVLGNVIMSLVDIAHGRTRHVPYRDSKLTFLLRDSLGGNARTSIVACVHPDARCFGETLSTLNFAKRAKMIKNKAVINEDSQGNVAHLQAEIKRLKDMLVQFQASNLPPALSSAVVPTNTTSVGQALPTVDVHEYRQKFLEAMLFREKAEQEKEVLRQRISGLEDEGKKKDRMLQSSRMVIKFRENRISMLEKNLKTAGTEPLAESVNNKVEEDIAAMKQQMEQYPQVSRLDHELHNLRAQLADARIRLSNTTATLLDANRLAQLEQAYRDLQATSRRDSGVVSPSSTGERSSVISTQKLREKMEALEDENQKLKKQLTEERQAWETKEAGLQAELTATNKMNKDLERVLEANHLKHRIERDALTNLHCHTLKVMTTPTRTAYDLRNRTVVVGEWKEKGDGLDTTIEMEEGMEDICQEAPPQESNNSLQERLNEYEADMLRLQQQVGQLDLKNASLTEMLAKERSDSSESQEQHERCLRELRDQVDTLTADLTYAREESRDLKILLQSSDRELKQERDKIKSNSNANDQKMNALETQAQSMLETVSLELEEAAKDKEQVTELLDTQRLEVAFLEERSAKLEAALQLETTAHHTTTAKLQVTPTAHHTTTAKLQVTPTAHHTTTAKLQVTPTAHHTTTAKLQVTPTAHHTTTAKLQVTPTAHHTTTAKLQVTPTAHHTTTAKLQVTPTTTTTTTAKLQVTPTAHHTTTAKLQVTPTTHHTTTAKLQEAERRLEKERENQEQRLGKQQEENMAEVSSLRQSLDEMSKERDEIQNRLEATLAELTASKTTITELRRDVADSQDLKSKLTAMEDEQEVVKEQAQSRTTELANLQELCESLQKQLGTKDEEINKMSVEVEMLREDLNYYQEQNEKMVHECEQQDSVRHKLETVQKEKDVLTEEITRIKQELSEREGRLQQITQHLEQARCQQGQPGSPEKNVEQNLYPFFVAFIRR
ncbi:hypothetical protein BaRGS_00027090 [Batillaria attramentaria]|uniref:Kinesin motor domain-containing protein n=1 Tax=Batillaria attramentaria TaxID=370345 RepID=A0ABD0K2T5_9CAEN